MPTQMKNAKAMETPALANSANIGMVTTKNNVTARSSRSPSR
jgi:hypothetical protein